MKTDTQLRHDVLDELQWEPSVDANQIGVMAKEGVITLTGLVTTFAEKVAAERVAKRVYGVRAVANDIAVHIPGDLARTDQEIAEAALHVLKWDAFAPDDRITVTVRDGRIILEGTVDSQYDKEAAGCAVRNLVGVKEVINSIVVKTEASPSEIKGLIESAFRRSAELDARRITVEVHGGKVVLHGNVSSWAEEEKAAQAAWAAPGVTEVDNQITVTP
ncbi:MAG TPA: BON domain-containing protein [Pirellulales bacterium]|nr:BON domain-containing protein [Pirellulales bacterium]